MRWFVLVVSGVLCCGCAGNGKSYVAPQLSPDQSAMLVQSGNMLSGDAIHIEAIDGADGPDKWFYKGPKGNIPIRPGMHTVVVHFADGRRYSVHSAEITFTADPGRKYQIQSWPPVVVDLVSRKRAPQRLRVAH